jgi:hypothetical protein
VFKEIPMSSLKDALKTAGDPPPAGPCHAALVRVIGEGHQPRKAYDGKPERLQYEIALGWELAVPGRPLLFQSLHFSDHEKSTWRNQLLAMLDRIPKDADFDPETHLGRTFKVVVKHSEGSRGDRFFADIASVTAPLPGFTPVVPQRTPRIFVVGDGPIPGWVDQLPRLFGVSPRARIERSPEYKQWQATQANGGNGADSPRKGAVEDDGETAF